MMDYYVYVHKCPNTNVVKYIGKGKGNRAFNLVNRYGYHKNWLKGLLLKNLLPIVEIIHKNLTEGQSFELEIFEIKRHKELGIKLTNLTNGGDGIPGYTHTLETKNKQSMAGYKRSVNEKLKGVSFDKRCPDKPWGARITISKGKRKYLGYFATQEEACNVYQKELNKITEA